MAFPFKRKSDQNFFSPPHNDEPLNALLMDKFLLFTLPWMDPVITCSLALH